MISWPCHDPWISSDGECPKRAPAAALELNKKAEQAHIA